MHMTAYSNEKIHGDGRVELIDRTRIEASSLYNKDLAPIVVAISMFTAVVATLAVNIAANVVSPANDFANAFPKVISFKTGGFITGLVGILGCGLAWGGLVVEPLKPLYSYAWFVGFAAAGLLYWALSAGRLAVSPDAGPATE
jgi:cytosine/uracil/thiamine/allantoin permease